MYHRIVRRRFRGAFAELSAGRFDGLLADSAPDVRHVFPGDHPLGGERNDRDAVRLWFQRLSRLFPGHDFEVHNVACQGGPWRTWVAVQWTATLRPEAGPTYANEGAHWFLLRWGTVREFHAYLDTQRIERSCRAMAEAGIAEASAAPIVDVA